MSRYQDLAAFVKKVRPYTSDMLVYGRELKGGGVVFVTMAFEEEVYQSLKEFEPWEPRRGHMFTDPALQWAIPVSEIKEYVPVREDGEFWWTTWLDRVKADMGAAEDE